MRVQVAWMCIVCALAAAAILLSARYKFTSHEDGHTVRMDRWTGEVCYLFPYKEAKCLR